MFAAWGRLESGTGPGAGPTLVPRELAPGLAYRDRFADHTGVAPDTTSGVYALEAAGPTLSDGLGATFPGWGAEPSSRPPTARG